MAETSKQIKNSDLFSDNEEEEDILAESAKKPGMFSDDEDEEEEDDEEEAAEIANNFIADDEDDEPEDDDATGGEVEDKESRAKKRKRRKSKGGNRESREDEGLDDDDVDLIAENLGEDTGRYKRIRKIGESTSNNAQSLDLDEMFNDDDDNQEASYAQDDLDDFIEDDQDDRDQEPSGMRDSRREKGVERSHRKQVDYDVNDEWSTIQEVFGDGTDYEWALQADDMEDVDVGENELKELRLEDVYEPGEIQDKMLTERDQKIRSEDVPERYLLMGDYIILNEEDEKDLIDRDALYVAREIEKQRNPNPELQITVSLDDKLTKAVRQVILFLRGEKSCFEVPFINRHRKDYFDELLNRSDLWKVHDLDVQFLQLEDRKRTLRTLLRQIMDNNEDSRSDPKLMDWNRTIDEATGLESLNDVQLGIQLYYGKTVQKIESGNVEYKRPVRKSIYEVAKDAGIGEFAKMYGVNVDEFAKCFVESVDTHVPEDPLDEPEIAAAAFVCPEFPTVESVLRAARHMVAQEISVHPSFRKSLRGVYEGDAAITTRPTEKGSREIDTSHPYYPFKYLTDKFIYEYKDAQQPISRTEEEEQAADTLAGQYLLISQAEERKMLTVTARVEVQEKLMEDVYKYIQNEFESDLARKWNAERVMVADEAMLKYVLPATEKWSKDDLRLSSSKWVAEQCQYAMEKKANVAGYRQRDDEDFSVLAISWGDGDRLSPTFAVQIDSNGSLISRTKIDFLNDFRPEVKNEAVEQLSDFIHKCKPTIIVVGGLNVSTKTKLMPMVQGIVDNTTSRDVNGVRVVIVNDDTTRIFMKSKRGIKEFPENYYPGMFRYCVGLARKVLDPTMEYAALFNKDEEYKALRLHPLQHLLSDKAFHDAVERALVNVVNECGVDINQAVAFPNMGHTLQFVSGFGIRKAQALIKEINSRGGRLEARRKIVPLQEEDGQHFICGPRILMNCISFLRIREKHFRDDIELEVLDDTRIHLEDYRLAQQMAVDALEVDKSTLEEEEMSIYVKDLMSPDRIGRLDLLLLDEFASELKKSEGLHKRVTLNDIKTELISPYYEKRRRFEEASVSEVFEMLTGETEETLHIGSVVNASVFRVAEKHVKCRLDSGLDAVIFLKNLSDDVMMGQGYENVAAEFVREGEVLKCVVIEINKEKLSVALSARVSDVENGLKRLGASKRDSRFDIKLEAQELEKMQDEIRRRQKNMSIPKILHADFREVDYRGAVEYLQDGAPGDFVIRPSSRGPNKLSITWKVWERIYHNIDVLMERSRDGGEIKYKVGNEYFDSVDQITIQYLDPMARFVKLATDNIKFKKNSKRELAQSISTQAQTTQRTAYGFTLSTDNPGCFDFMYYHPGAKVREDLIVVKPKGYEFRRKVFRSMDDLIGYWKVEEMEKAKSQKRSGQSSSSSSQQPRPSVQDPRHNRQFAPSGYQPRTTMNRA